MKFFDWFTLLVSGALGVGVFLSFLEFLKLVNVWWP
jgi:hypothetical protein